jgi:hypothetical protein
MNLLHLIFGDKSFILAFVKVVIVELVEECFYLGGEFTLGSIKGTEVPEEVCFEVIFIGGSFDGSCAVMMSE